MAGSWHTSGPFCWWLRWSIYMIKISQKLSQDVRSFIKRRWGQRQCAFLYHKRRGGIYLIREEKEELLCQPQPLFPSWTAHRRLPLRPPTSKNLFRKALKSDKPPTHPQKDPHRGVHARSILLMNSFILQTKTRPTYSEKQKKTKKNTTIHNP